MLGYGTPLTMLSLARTGLESDKSEWRVDYEAKRRAEAEARSKAEVEKAMRCNQVYKDLGPFWFLKKKKLRAAGCGATFSKSLEEFDDYQDQFPPPVRRPAPAPPASTSMVTSPELTYFSALTPSGVYTQGRVRANSGVQHVRPTRLFAPLLAPNAPRKTGRGGGVMDENEAMKVYQQGIGKAKRQMGSNFMFSDALDACARSMVGPTFMGVFARDQLDYNSMRPGQTAIVNTKPSSHGGEHWCGVGCDRQNRIVVYDSFGRKGAGLLHIPGAVDTDLDAEQKVEEVDCGPRSVSWCVLFSRSPEAAMLI